MDEKIAIVTGAHAGLGYNTTQKLLREGYSVVMGCRCLETANTAREQLLKEAPEANLEIIPLDLSVPDSVAAFSDAFAARFGRLNLLINNAAIMGVPLTRNDAGFELHLATNYLGPFALTGLLLPYFEGDQPGRIVNVGRLAHRIGKLPLDDINWQRDHYKPMAAYDRSKLAWQCFTQELARRLAACDSTVIAVGAHPGFAATEIGNKSGYTQPKGPLRQWFLDRMRGLIPGPEVACEPIMLAALGEEVENGDYCGPGGFMEFKGASAPAKVHKLAHDEDTGRRLWALSEEMTGVYFLSAGATTPGGPPPNTC
ncbi:SDR family NAD(P)-dependent oxidoreductase [Seongchinamella unica]|uniref:SDR family NAD(P)-dependent oxidoreductase n=1 Tax=Seongchinamella unica TaxID=2547392 RepID=UPI001404835F|nr:SDR family NAD(P)-dependent oxidoreductase [Seongchinamella unica]